MKWLDAEESEVSKLEEGNGIPDVTGKMDDGNSSDDHNDSETESEPHM